MDYTMFKGYTGRVIVSKFLFWYSIKAECVGYTVEWRDGSENPEFKYWERVSQEDLINFEIKLKDGH